MNRLFAILLFILAIFGFSGCVQPVGSISNSEGEYNDFFINALKKEYYISDPNSNAIWRTDRHIQIIGKVNIDNSLLKIELESDPLSISAPVYKELAHDEKFEFALPGDYILKGTYNGKTAKTYFEVKGSPTVSGDGSAGIGMDWFPEDP